MNCRVLLGKWLLRRELADLRGHDEWATKMEGATHRALIRVREERNEAIRRGVMVSRVAGAHFNEIRRLRKEIDKEIRLRETISRGTASYCDEVERLRGLLKEALPYVPPCTSTEEAIQKALGQRN